MPKKVIMLVCSAGMSTGLLVSRMEEAATKLGVDATIFAVGAATVNQHLADVTPDAILVGPQVSYMADKLRDKLSIPIAVMDMHDYETLAGENLLRAAMTTINEGQTQA